jgi:hypothetical protein
MRATDYVDRETIPVAAPDQEQLLGVLTEAEALRRLGESEDHIDLLVAFQLAYDSERPTVVPPPALEIELDDGDWT